MGEVIYLGDMAWLMNKLRKSIAHDIANNASGMHTEAIQKQKSLLRSFMDDIVRGPTEAVENELAA